MTADNLTIEQRLARLESLYTILENGQIVLNEVALPDASTQQISDLKQKLAAVPTTTPVTPAPVVPTPAPTPTPTPVPTPAPVVSKEILPTKLTAGFTLTGFDELTYPVDLVAGVTYLARLNVDVAKDGGVNFELAHPTQSGKGIEYHKLEVKDQTFTITATKTEMRLFRVYGNGTSNSHLTASFTKK